ncbi:MAG: DsbA family protein [Promethearchaeota archaeon]
MSHHIIEVVEYQDPYCTWCWGSEPILRKIQELYGDQVKITVKAGGLIETLDEQIAQQWFVQVAQHWLDASERHGMPVDVQVWQDLQGEFRSTYPANIAYKAAQMQNPELADKFLRRMREAAAAERRYIHKREVQVELAMEVGLDSEKFVEVLETNSAEKAFYEDLEEFRATGSKAYPTFLITHMQGKRALLTGYRRFEFFERILKDLAGDELVKKKLEATSENILAFIRKYDKVATREVAEVFDLTDMQAKDMLEILESEGSVVGTKAGNSYFWLLPVRT